MKLITVCFYEVNFATVPVFLKTGETVAEALKSRKDGYCINGYFTESGEYVAI